jgi:hypothetical protein
MPQNRFRCGVDARALTTAGTSAALFRDASTAKGGLAHCAKNLTLVRLGLLAAALCWCFVAVPSLSAGVMVMETLPARRPSLLLGRRGSTTAAEGTFRTVPA